MLPNALFAFGAARRMSLDSDDARLREARRLVGHGALKWLLSAVLMAVAVFWLRWAAGVFCALTLAIRSQMIAPLLPWVDAEQPEHMGVFLKQAPCGDGTGLTQRR